MIQSTSTWRNSRFVVYFFMTLFSKVGDKVYLIGMPWLVYNLTRSALGMGTMFLMETLPYIFIAPLAGILVDKMPRKFLLMLTSVMQASCIGCVLVLGALSFLRVEYVYFLGLALSCASATYMVLNDTLIPQLFQEKFLVKVNSTVQFLETSTLLLGTAMAGILISLFGVFGVLGIVAASYIIVCLLAYFLRLNPHNFDAQRADSQQQTSGGFREIFQYVIHHPIIGPLASLNLLANVAAASIEALLIYFTRNRLGLPSTQVGLIYGLAGVAEIGGVLMVPLLVRERSTGIKPMLCCQFVFAVGVIWTAFSWNMLSVAAGMMVQNGAIVIYNVFSRSLRQQTVPPAMLGRVNGIFLMLGQTAYPLAGFVSALLSNFIGVQYVFGALGSFAFLVAAIYWLSPFRKIQLVSSLPTNEASYQRELETVPGKSP